LKHNEKDDGIDHARQPLKWRLQGHRKVTRRPGKKISIRKCGQQISGTMLRKMKVATKDIIEYRQVFCGPRSTGSDKAKVR